MALLAFRIRQTFFFKAMDKHLPFVLRWDVDVMHSDYLSWSTTGGILKGPDFLTVQNHVSASWNLVIHFRRSCDGVQEDPGLFLVNTTNGYSYTSSLSDVRVEVGIMKNDGSIIGRKILPTVQNPPRYRMFGSYLLVNNVNFLRECGLLLNGNLLRLVVKLSIPEEYFDPVNALSRVPLPTIITSYPEHSGEFFSSRFPQVTGEDQFNELDGIKFTVVAAVPDAERPFSCHLHVLHSNIPDYIQPLMRSDSEEANNKAVIWYFHPEVVLETLRFMYSGQCSDSFGQLASEVVELAEYLMFWALKGKCEAKMVETVNENLVEKFAEKGDRLSLSRLKKPCQEIMIRKIGMRNAVKYLLLAKKYGYQVLQHVAATFVVENLREIKARSGSLASLEEQIGKSSLDKIMDLVCAVRVYTAVD